MIREEEHGALIDDLAASMATQDPGRVWDEIVNVDGLGLIGVDIATVAFNQTRSRVVMALSLLNLIEQRIRDGAKRLAEEEAKSALYQPPRRRRNGAQLSEQEREDAEDLS